jgi:hypothetical protein
MPDQSGFWAKVAAQLKELRSATTADAVVAILSHERNPYGPGVSTEGDGFFAGSGGDDTVYEALMEAGWVPIWYMAAYHYALRAPDGTAITYVEGDIYIGNRDGH